MIELFLTLLEVSLEPSHGMFYKTEPLNYNIYIINVERPNDLLISLNLMLFLPYRVDQYEKSEDDPRDPEKDYDHKGQGSDDC